MRFVRSVHVWTSLILMLYLILGSLFAWRVPAWQAPDEPAHYNYIAQVAGGQFLPVIAPGDWDNEVLESLKAERFPPERRAEIDSIRYENHQPPLYYWLATPVFLLSDGALLALRLFSVLLGAGTILLSGTITRLVLPHQPHIAIAVMALLAFLPQHLHMLASINNDALAGLLVALTLWACLRYLRHDARISPWTLGLLLGLVVITKTTAYFLAAVVALALLLRPAQSHRQRLLAALRVALVAGPFALLYWGRNISVYGFPDFLGLRAHDAIVVGQLRSADALAQIGWEAYLSQAIQTSFNSFWGQFGWMGVPMFGIFSPGDNLIYPLIALLMLLGFIALALRPFVGRMRPPDVPALQRSDLALLVLTALLSLGAFIYYNTEFQQFQGRYLFTALIPFAIGLLLGLDALRHMLLGPRGRWLLPLLMLLFALLDLWLIWRVLPGALSPD